MPKANSTLKRSILAVVGLASVSIGMLGILVPGLPTTVFILIALWAFSQSSERLQRMLYRIPWLKGAIGEAELFAQHRQIKRRSKIVAQVFAWGAFILSVALHWPVTILVIFFAAALSCSAFMWWANELPDPTSERSLCLPSAPALDKTPEHCS